MRKAIMIGVGLASAAVVATAGIATAGTANGRPDPTSTNSMVTTTVSQDEAEQIALATVDGTVVETRLDEDNGRPVWNVHLATANGTVEVRVDAETGAARIDDDADEAGEDADDDADDDHGGHGDGVDDSHAQTGVRDHERPADAKRSRRGRRTSAGVGIR